MTPEGEDALKPELHPPRRSRAELQHRDSPGGWDRPGANLFRLVGPAGSPLLGTAPPERPTWSILQMLDARSAGRALRPRTASANAEEQGQTCRPLRLRPPPSITTSTRGRRVSREPATRYSPEDGGDPLLDIARKLELPEKIRGYFHRWEAVSERQFYSGDDLAGDTDDLFTVLLLRLACRLDRPLERAAQ